MDIKSPMHTLTRKRAKYGFFLTALWTKLVFGLKAIHLYTHAFCERKGSPQKPCSSVSIVPPNQDECEDSCGGGEILKKLQPFATFKTVGRTKKIIAWLCLLHPTPPLRSQERRTSPFPRIQGVAAQNYLKDTPPLPFPSPGISSSKSMSSCPSSSLLSDPGIFIS